MDGSSLSTDYSNFFRVTAMPEELVMDFGLHVQINALPGERVKLTHRVVMNFYNAKRLLEGLHRVVTEHEKAFGVLEVDIQKRARGQ